MAFFGKSREIVDTPTQIGDPANKRSRLEGWRWSDKSVL